jgi:OmpA-OmpF porin, OOP family
VIPKNIKLKIVLPAVGLLLAQAGTAQRYSGYFGQAEKLYKSNQYYEAAQVYEKYLATEKNSQPRSTPFAVDKKRKGRRNMNPHQEAVYHLAESYRMLNDYAHAEKYYKQATGFPQRTYPASRYWYAVSLRAEQKYDSALTELNRFLEKHTEMDALLMGADQEMENLKFIQAQGGRVNDRFTVTAKPEPKNVSAYALTIKNEDTVVYTTIHQEAGTRETRFQPTYNDALVMAPSQEDPYAGVTAMKETDSKDENSGLATFSHDGRHMFFTRWTKINGVTASKLYHSIHTDTGWSAPVASPEPLNVAGTNNAQPSLTGDGRYLFFSSDRPGGSGGYDIWQASLDSNGDPIQVENLGNVINTPGNEQAPYYHDHSRTLVFSTNGRTGMGGYDLFYSHGSFNMRGWEKPQNAGAPLNSSKDDMYYVSTDNENLWNTGWVSSDRASDCCMALFSVVENNARLVKGYAVNAKTGKPLANVVITVTDKRHHDKLLGTYKTDSTGHYAFEIHNTGHVNIDANKAGYINSKTSLDIEDVSGKDSVLQDPLALAPARDEDEELRGLLDGLTRSSRIGNFAYKKAELNDSSSDKLDSLAALLINRPQLVIQVEGYTDGIGSDAYNLKLAQKRVDVCINYLVKKGVSRKQLVGKAMGECCPILPEIVDGKDDPHAREINRRVEYRVLRK